MASDLTELTEIERDAISEIANMGVSRAAASLRQMVGEQVLLSVPNVRIVSRQEAAGLVERGSPNLVAVRQSFEGPFSGRALLIFPQAQSLELVRSIVGAEHSLDDVIDLEQEALAETGNIILNACLATIANVCKTPEPEVTILTFTPFGPVLAVRPYCHNDHYWQVYFDTNMVIREVLGDVAFPGPVYPLAVHGQSSAATA